MKETKEINGVHYLKDVVYETIGADGFKQRYGVHLDKGTRLRYDYVDLVIYDDNMNAVEIFRGVNPEEVKEGETARYITHLSVGPVCSPISERSGLGVCYYEDGVLVDNETIEKSLAHAQAVDRQRKIEEEIEFQERQAKKQETLKEWEGVLTPLQPSDDRNKVAKKNLMALLKHEFPGVKFTARKGWSMTVRWTDGPTEKEVKKVCSRFVRIFDGDSYTDYYSTTDSTFTSCFGGWDIVSYERNISDEFLEEMEEMTTLFDSYDDFRNYCYQHFNKCDDDTERRSSWARTLARYTSKYRKPKKPEPKAAKQKASTETDGVLVIVDYSEKAIALLGNTKEVKEQLKKLGGRFNPRLSCGPGWIFSKKKEAELRSCLNI